MKIPGLDEFIGKSCQAKNKTKKIILILNYSRVNKKGGNTS